MTAINRIFLKTSGFIFINIFINFSLSSCKDYHKNLAHADVSDISIREGKVLAKKYCVSCHMLPDPAWIDSKSWENGVLPQMGPRLGIYKYGFETYPSYKRDLYLDSAFYPAEPLLSLAQWGDIFNYFVATSPDSLLPQKRKNHIEFGLSLFKPITPQIFIQNPATCFIKIDANNFTYPLIISDAVTDNLYFINKDLIVLDSLNLAGPVVDMDSSRIGIMACNIGVLNPNNGKFGSGQVIHINANGKINKDSSNAFDKLQRPVQITSADLNNDGKTDYLVCEFGFLTGALSWMENIGENKFTRHILRPFPGAIKAYINDYNHDGLPDIWVLFAQGEEGIFLYTNKGNGNFDEQEILRFPPVYGSSYFELDDFNKDGYPDIVYTCGDNADYSTVLKPYHGVYIFINDKTNHFAQKYFFPINGCYKAIARDYDNDGDLDIAAISFFADYEHQPEEGFVYLKNMSNFNFKPYSIPETKSGRWLTMDAGDINGDGKIDLVLGNFSRAPGMIKSNVNWTKNSSYVVLMNTGN